MSTLHHAGCDLAYQIQGEGPPVVFIQGVGLHGAGWLPQVGELSGRIPVFPSTIGGWHAVSPSERRS